MTPRTVPAIMLRACWCWWGGKKSSMRLIDSVASTVWIVESTRWPVSAADRAVWTVSSSRISPTRITSGSWRSTLRRARLKEAVSMPTSRWLIAERLSSCTNSIGSSIVTMCLLIVWFMWSIIAASVVDLPEPVVPVSRTMPRSSSASSRTTSGSESSSIVLILWGIARQTIEIVPALAEGVDPEAGDALDFVGEVDLVVLRELFELALVAEQRAQRAFGVRGGQLALTRGRASARREPGAAGRSPTFRWRSEPSLATSSRSASLTSNMAPDRHRRPGLNAAEWTKPAVRASGAPALLRSGSGPLEGRRSVACDDGERPRTPSAARGAVRRRRGASVPPRATAASSATGSRSGGSARA